MSVAALILWAFTAGIGVYLLMFVNAAKRRDDEPTARAVTPAAATATGAVGRGGRSATPPTPHITHTRVTSGPGEHPLLEFLHPAFGIVGLGGWLAFTFIRYPGFGWFAFGVLVLAVAAGLLWLTGNLRAARRRRARVATETGAAPVARRAPTVPRHVVVLHGLAAAATLVLAATTFVVARL